jgi:cbb3-type cytochrome oxidase subunit 1
MPKPAPVLPGPRALPAAPANARSPSVGLPLRFVLTGLAALAAGVALLIAWPDILATYHYNQYVVAATHLFVLGFVCSVVMGAMYQLVPVALEVRLHSERLAKVQFIFHVIGVAGMVFMFWRWDLKQVGHFGSALAFGVGLFVYNVARTLRRVPRWNVVAGGVTSALVWLSVTVLIGLSVAAAKCSYDSVERPGATNALGLLVRGLGAVAAYVNRFDPLAVMHTHAHLGVVGFFLMMIVAVSFKLVPMFALSELQNERRARWTVWLLNAGLAGLLVTLPARSPWRYGAVAALLAALVAYGLELRAILRARNRRTLDWGLRYFLTAVSLLGPLALLGAMLAWSGLRATALTTQLENVYGLLGILGVVTFTIMGFLYKIVPFLAWYHSYSRHIGRHKVPALADLYSTRLQAIGYWLFLAGLLNAAVWTATGQARGVRFSCLLLAASLALFAANLGRILSHFVRPRIGALAKVAPPAASLT